MLRYSILREGFCYATHAISLTTNNGYKYLLPLCPGLGTAQDRCDFIISKLSRRLERLEGIHIFWLTDLINRRPCTYNLTTFLSFFLTFPKNDLFHIANSIYQNTIPYSNEHSTIQVLFNFQFTLFFFYKMDSLTKTVQRGCSSVPCRYSKGFARSICQGIRG